MIKIIEDAVKVMLKERAALISQNILSPRNYTGVRDEIIQLELKQELHTLELMLLEPDTFEQQFKRRCIEREADTERTISFHIMPESPCNRLYWDIAQLVFEPQTMADMLGIVLPGIKRHLKADLDLTLELPLQRKDAGYARQMVNQAKPVLNQLDNLNKFKETRPEIEAFTHYILSNDILFDASEVACFPLVQQAGLQSQLTEHYARVAKQLYAHNMSLQNLALDIAALNNEGISPKAAIEQLIHGLILGGEKMTGQIYAGKSSIEAVGHFSAYFNALPLGIKEQLRNLEGDGVTLGRIIDEEIAAGKCVETTSEKLIRILKNNINQSALVSPPAMTLADLNALKGKYGPKHPLDTRKNDTQLLLFPRQLINEVIRRIRPQNIEELICLILDFPPSFYDLFWKNVTLDNPRYAFEHFTLIENAGYFNPEQRQTLAAAIAQNYSRFNLKPPLLSWAVKNNDPVFIEESMKHVQQNERLDVVRQRIVNGFTLLDLIVMRDKPVLFKTVLDLLPDDVQRFEAVASKNEYGSTVLHLAAGSSIETLDIVLDVYPESQRLSAIKVIDGVGKSVLDKARFKPETLIALLKLYPEEERMDALTVDERGNSVLHHYAGTPEVFNSILSLLPKEHQLEAVKVINKEGDTVLHLVNNPEFFQAILAVYPDEQRLDAVKKMNNKGNTPLHSAIDNAELIKVILEVYPPEQRLDAVTKVNNEGCCVLYQNLYYHKSFKVILELMPDNQKMSLCLMADRRGESILNYFVYSPEFPGILKLLPISQRLDALKIVNKAGRSLFLDYVTTDPETHREILHLLTNEQQLEVLGMSNQLGSTVLHQYAGFPEVLKTIWSFLSDKQRLSMVKVTNKKGNTVLHLAANTLESLNVVLNVYPNVQRLNAVKATNGEGKTVLQKSINSPWCFITLLALYPEEERLVALKSVEDNFGATVLHKNAANPEILKAILQLLPKQQRLDVVKATELYYGNTVLHFAADYPESLKAILELLPEEQRLDRIMAFNSSNERVLHLASDNPESIKVILEVCSEKERLFFLHTTFNKQSIMARLLSSSTQISATENAFKDSFVPAYLAIHRFLAAQAVRKVNLSAFFSDSGDQREAAELVKALYQYKSMDEVKHYLSDYVIHQPETPVTTAIIGILEQNNTDSLLHNPHLHFA